MKYTVYKTINTINGRSYIGVHKTENPDDSYRGSGKILRLAFKLYGKENFTKEVLFSFDSAAEAYLKEKELVNKEYLSRKDVYNVAPGGSVSPDWNDPDRLNRQKDRKSFLGHKHTEETKKKIRKSSLGRKHSDEVKKRIASSQVGRVSANKGKTNSVESNERRSISQKNVTKLKCPHCGESIDPGNAKRWHFEKCSKNPNRGLDRI